MSRQDAQRAQCKLNHPKGSEAGGCPCRYASDCRFPEIRASKLGPEMGMPEAPKACVCKRPLPIHGLTICPICGGLKG